MARITRVGTMRSTTTTSATRQTSTAATTRQPAEGRCDVSSSPTAACCSSPIPRVSVAQRAPDRAEGPTPSDTAGVAQLPSLPMPGPLGGITQERRYPRTTGADGAPRRWGGHAGADGTSPPSSVDRRDGGHGARARCLHRAARGRGTRPVRGRDLRRSTSSSSPRPSPPSSPSSASRPAPRPRSPRRWTCTAP